MVAEFPTSVDFRALQFGNTPNTTVFKSPTNRAVQSFELPGGQWYGTWEVRRSSLEDIAKWKAFLTDLSGPAGRFHGTDPSRITPFGIYSSGSDTPLVDGGSETGKTLATKGWRNSGTGLLLAGDLFELTISSVKRLYMVTAQVDSDGSGDVTISITPPLIDSPADNLALVLTSPKVEMQLVDDRQSLWDVPTNRLVTGFTFSGIEVI